MTLDAAPVVRAATAADLDRVAEIYAFYVLHTVATFEETPPGAAGWRARLDDLAARGLPFLVAEVSGEVVGYAYAGPWRPKPAYRHTAETSVYLARDRRGHGLGGTLLAALLTACAGTPVRRLIAVVAADDTTGAASIALHGRHGFTQAGRLTAVGFKHGRWIDTVLMERAVGGVGLP
ncbi:GNAT family N-acetyltransferase [Streptomyces sp. NPDC086091]|uniref:GNAT family N-acetyltransferase n=1 Tax=Streptomyces sp. NPDC086091 TaxID=3365751 RepID=UPI0037F6D341